MTYIRRYTLIYNFYNDSERHMVILVTFLLIYQDDAPVNMCICFIIDTYRMSLTVSNIICKLGLTLHNNNNYEKALMHGRLRS